MTLQWILFLMEWGMPHNFRKSYLIECQLQNFYLLKIMKTTYIPKNLCLINFHNNQSTKNEHRAVWNMEKYRSKNWTNCKVAWMGWCWMKSRELIWRPESPKEHFHWEWIVKLIRFKNYNPLAPIKAFWINSRI